MRTQVFCDPARTYIVCVDSYDEKVLRGRIHNVLHDASITFTSTVDMLLKLEALLDEAKLLQSYATKRVFTPNKPIGALAPGMASVDEGKLATFSLKLLFRQNVSWQGSVLWCEGNSEEAFRSVLELLLLMDNALSN